MGITVKEKSKDKLGRAVRDEVTNMFQKVLDYAQLICPTGEVYKSFRSKVLRTGNDCIRNIENKLEFYDIEFVPTSEDIIQVSAPKVIKKSSSAAKKNQEQA